MKIFSKLICICFIFSIFILNNSKLANSIGHVDWLLLKENDDGKEWLDMGSINVLNNEEISVLTKFYENPKDSSDKGKLSLYVMRINCDSNTFKDTSLNGIPQLSSKWQTSNNDDLIDAVIEKSCSLRTN